MPLTNKIDAFVGIAGANKGLTSCYVTNGNTPTCNRINGFYPAILQIMDFPNFF
ncbi:MAG: hypothetical protein IPN93_02935 [Bacteroidetes bacterium]|nr:hypothetical protein [Bacteroidota bacterium]MBK9634273.1 hypothetical protein [Bacteroidota bacterium]